MPLRSDNGGGLELLIGKFNDHATLFMKFFDRLGNFLMRDGAFVFHDFS